MDEKTGLREEIDVGDASRRETRVRKDLCIKREELEMKSEFGVIFEGEDGIKRED